MVILGNLWLRALGYWSYLEWLEKGVPYKFPTDVSEVYVEEPWHLSTKGLRCNSRMAVWNLNNLNEGY